MTLEDYHVLYEVLRELRQEAGELQVQIEEHSGSIREAQMHLKAIENLEPEDRKFFTPRKVEILYKEEIERIKEESSFHEEQMQCLRNRKAVIDGQISRLEAVCSHEDKDFSSWTELDRDRFHAFLADLEKIIHRIHGSSGHIDKNPIQARQDFLIIEKSLKETVERIRDMVK